MAGYFTITSIDQTAQFLDSLKRFYEKNYIDSPAGKY